MASKRVELTPQLLPIAKLFARDKAVTAFKASSLCVDDKVFVMVVKGNLVLKLPAARCAELVEQGVGQLHDIGNGRLMKEWLAIAPAKKAAALKLVKESRAFAAPSK